jgi:hypothetical protein
MGVSFVPTWADIIAIGLTMLSGAYTYGVLGQKVTALEEKARNAEELAHDFHDLTNRLTGLEVSMTNVETLLREVRDTVARLK